MDEHYYDINTPEPYKTYANNNFLFEPGVFIRMGGEKLKFNIRLNGCWIAQFSNTGKYIPYTYLNLGLSLNYTLKK